MTNIQLFWLILALIWISIEIFIVISTRKHQTLANKSELRSEGLIWLVICLSLLAALSLKTMHWLPVPLSTNNRLWTGLFFVLGGLGLRAYAVYTLGHFFNTRVSIHLKHQLVTTGPYQYVRHPSYSGLLCSFFGVGIAMGDCLSILSLVLPLIIILYKRINIEEPLLASHFGETYRLYCFQTKKLLPGIY